MDPQPPEFSPLTERPYLAQAPPRLVAAPPSPPHPIPGTDLGVSGQEPSIGLASAFLASHEGFLQLARAVARPRGREGGSGDA